jgi:hypothetical protein
MFSSIQEQHYTPFEKEKEKVNIFEKTFECIFGIKKT